MQSRKTTHKNQKPNKYKANTPCGTSMRDWQLLNNVNVFMPDVQTFFSEWTKESAIRSSGVEMHSGPVNNVLRLQRLQIEELKIVI